MKNQIKTISTIKPLSKNELKAIVGGCNALTGPRIFCPELKQYVCAELC